MPEPGNNGLEADIGVTLGKLQRQMAAAEARMIRAAKKGEDAFKRANPRIAKSFDQIDQASRRIGAGANGARNGLRQASLQLSQVAQQGQVTGNYLQALAIQLPDLGLAFGTFGIAAGVAAGALLPLIGNIGGADDAMDKLVDSLVGGEVGLSSARSSIDQLRQLQEQYTSAIEASAAASGGTAAAVAANSRREFEARKQVLAVEVELLRIRQQEQKSDLKNLKDQQAIAAQLRAESNSSGLGNRFTPRDGAEFFNSGPRTSAEVLGEGFIKDNERNVLAIRKLNAELELTALAIEESNKALNGEFSDIGGAASGSGANGGGGSGGGSVRRAAKLREELKEVDAALKNVEATAQSASGQFSQFLSSIITGANSAEEAVKRLADSLLNNLLDQALRPVSNALGAAFGNALFGTVGRGPSIPSFDGGGFTGVGSRSGGVDGRGGFPAILHPNETVIDHTRASGGGMTVMQTINVNGSGLSADEVAGRLAPLMQAKAVQVFARARREGR